MERRRIAASREPDLRLAFRRITLKSRLMRYEPSPPQVYGDDSHPVPRYIYAVCTRPDSPLASLRGMTWIDEMKCTYGVRPGNDVGYYITDQICETFCGPAHIGEEVELTYYWEGETDTRRKRSFRVLSARDMEADIICPQGMF